MQDILRACLLALSAFVKKYRDWPADMPYILRPGKNRDKPKPHPPCNARSTAKAKCWFGILLYLPSDTLSRCRRCKALNSFVSFRSKAPTEA